MTAALKRLGRSGDRADLDAYMASEEAAMLKGLIMTKSIPAVAAAYDRALRKIEMRFKPLAKGPARARWTIETQMQLKAAWERHGGNVYRVARDLGITERAAQRAYERYLAPGTPAPSQPQDRPALAA
jgi:transcriptional regulator with PAS, ATPase and Fis domain